MFFIGLVVGIILFFTLLYFRVRKMEKENEITLSEIAQADLQNPDSVVPFFGAYNKIEHANILACYIYDKNPTTAFAYDFSKFTEENRIIYLLAYTKDEEKDGAIAILKDITFYQFKEGLCYWL